MSILGKIARDCTHLPWLHPNERSVLAKIGDCTTGRLGSNLMMCRCGHREVHHNSCRDRHCPLCQGAARARWVSQRINELLPCPYFHVVFTIPYQLRNMAYSNKAVFYREMFRCVHETLTEVALRPENLGARLGGLSILHTWNQKLAFHPHIHCIVPGGGPNPEYTKWIQGNPSYLLPVRKLSAVFRGKLLSGLQGLHNQGKLYETGPEKIQTALRRAAGKKFVVYSKRPFGSPAQVVSYLGRYTHRVGLSEQRIVAYDETTVTFSWIDRKNGHCKKQLCLPTEEFLKKFLLHMIPKGIKKIRYFGFMANKNKQENLLAVRTLLKSTGCALSDNERISCDVAKSHVHPCPDCGQELVLHAADTWRTCRTTLKRRIIRTWIEKYDHQLSPITMGAG
ncbi:IS91 family transposase [Spirochaeta dissipatitropha]